MENKSMTVPDGADLPPIGRSDLDTGLDSEIARLIEQAQEQGLQLTGEGGLLPGMIKQAVEAAMGAEMTDHRAMTVMPSSAAAAVTPAMDTKAQGCKTTPGRSRWTGPGITMVSSTRSSFPKGSVG